MPKTMDQLVSEILKDNPQIDSGKIAEEHAKTAQRRALGYRGRGYRLTGTMFRERVRTSEDDSNDPRTVHLRQR